MDTRLALKKAEELAYQKLAPRCQVDLFFLCKYVLGYDIITERVHGPVCAATRPILFWKDKERAKAFVFPSDFGRTEEQGLPTEEEKQAFFEELKKFMPPAGADEEPLDKFNMDLNQLLALLPRGTLKTSVITIGFTLQYFLNYPDNRVLLDSETSTNSCGFLGEIKGHFEGNEIYRNVFYAVHGVMPDDNSKDKNTRWHSSAIDLACRKRARKEASIDTGGVDTTKNSRHYDLIIFDDLHSEINTKTKDQIEKVKEHWKLAYSLLDPNCPAIVIGTRWTHNDLYQLIIDEHSEKFNFITRQAKADDGELLYPAKLNQEYLDAQRERQGSYIFSCQYMNSPVDSETAAFKRDWFQYKNWRDIEGVPINWYMTIDPSFAGDSSDFAAFVISGIDYQQNLYVRYILKAKMNYAQIVQKTFELFRQFQPRQVVVETVATQKSIEYTYKEKQREMGFWLPIRYLNQRVKAKEDRILGLAPKYEYGHVYHVRECPQIKELEDELIHFPKSKNDDVSDAFATVLDVASPPMRSMQQLQHKRDRRKLFKKLNAPRSPMVGY